MSDEMRTWKPVQEWSFVDVVLTNGDESEQRRFVGVSQSTGIPSSCVVERKDMCSERRSNFVAQGLRLAMTDVPALAWSGLIKQLDIRALSHDT